VPILDDQELEDLKAVFNDKERLLIHQLRLLEWLSARHEGKTGDAAVVATVSAVEVPEKWQLTKGVTLYPWQELCIERWFEAGCRGTVKVVTGGGKTLLALALAEFLQNCQDPDLHVAVVVPTIVLMHQWYDELLEKGNIPREAIGRMGGGYKDDFSGGRRILISVLASAWKELPKMVEKNQVGKNLLLIADECHRFGAKEMSQIFATERTYSLGLSATPERDDDENDDLLGGFDETLLGKELGSIIYEFTLAEALALGIIPSFTINHYGVPLLPEERAKYDRLSRSISEAQSELRANMPEDRNSSGSFFQWVRSVAQKGGRLSSLASQFVGDTSRRKEIIYGITSRIQAVGELIRKEFVVNPDARVILFHESINEVMKLFLYLKNAGYPVIAEHSDLPNSIRESGLELFRKGTAQIIVSARSLIEGFNVPAVDVGIIVASSSSVRQRVQSLGRVLRKHRSASGEEKTSCIHVLYAHDTVDNAIYGKEDWSRFTGIDRNIYYVWTPGEEPVLQDGPPRTPLATELEINPDELQPGCLYRGQYEGVELSCDTRGNIRGLDDRYVLNVGNLAEKVIALKGNAGRFKVTPQRRYVLVCLPQDEEWIFRYVTTLDDPLEFETAEPVAEIDLAYLDEWVANTAPGVPYPFSGNFEKVEDVNFSRKRNGVISKKIPGGEVFARVGGNAHDTAKGDDASKLMDAIRQVMGKGKIISRLEVNEKGHVLFREGGRLLFLYALRQGLEFPNTD